VLILSFGANEKIKKASRSLLALLLTACIKPKPSIRSAQRELFRVELVNLVDLEHPLVRLGGKINWGRV
jgi:starvation-inducible outer membrane lipoprotein